jgi:hypothetical protein
MPSLLTVEAQRATEQGRVVRGDPAGLEDRGLVGSGSGAQVQVHRRTVREALTSAFPKPRKKQPPRQSRLDPFKPAVDAMLHADLDAPRKQRHTARRIFDRLVAEHEMEGISYATVSDYVGCAAPRSGARRAGSRPRCSSRRLIGRTRTPRSTSARSGCGWPAGPPAVICSPSGCRSPARRCTGCSPPAGRRRSWRDTCTPSACWAGFRPARSATTTCARRCARSWGSPAPGLIGRPE